MFVRNSVEVWRILMKANTDSGNQGCSPRDRGVGLESTRDRFFLVLVLVLVLALPVLTTSLAATRNSKQSIEKSYNLLTGYNQVAVK